MDQVQVKILGLAITSRGTYNTGDIVRTDAAFAKHLVEDAHVAEYDGVSPGAQEAADAAAKAKADQEAADAAAKAKADQEAADAAAKAKADQEAADAAAKAKADQEAADAAAKATTAKQTGKK